LIFIDIEQEILKMTRTWTHAAAAALLVFASAFALAADETPDATIEFSGGSAAVAVGVKWAKGTLHYQGQAYPFHLSGFSLLDLGGSEVNGTGEVYHLAKVSDFTGDYAAVSAGATVDRGETSASMRNQHGVVIQMHSNTKGVQFNASVEAVSIIVDGGPQ
jgi:hypothetical protein